MSDLESATIAGRAILRVVAVEDISVRINLQHGLDPAALVAQLERVTVRAHSKAVRTDTVHPGTIIALADDSHTEGGVGLADHAGAADSVVDALHSGKEGGRGLAEYAGAYRAVAENSRADAGILHLQLGSSRRRSPDSDVASRVERHTGGVVPGEKPQRVVRLCAKPTGRRASSAWPNPCPDLNHSIRMNHAVVPRRGLDGQVLSGRERAHPDEARCVHRQTWLSVVDEQVQGIIGQRPEPASGRPGLRAADVGPKLHSDRPQSDG